MRIGRQEGSEERAKQILLAHSLTNTPPTLRVEQTQSEFARSPSCGYSTRLRLDIAAGLDPSLQVEGCSFYRFLPSAICNFPKSIQSDANGALVLRSFLRSPVAPALFTCQLQEIPIGRRAFHSTHSDLQVYAS